jgi:hypothetical protein
MKGPVTSTISRSEKGSGRRLGTRGTARRNLLDTAIPWAQSNRSLGVRRLQADFSAADDGARVGLHPRRCIPIRGNNETVMGTGFQGCSRAVGINCVCSGHIDVSLDIAVNIQREGCPSVSVSVVSDLVRLSDSGVHSHSYQRTVHFCTAHFWMNLLGWD